MVGQVETMVRLEVSVDSADTGVLERVAAGLHRPGWINSLPVDFEWTDGLRTLLREGRHDVVLSLRRRDALPTDAVTRLGWAEEGLVRLVGAGVDPRRVFVDAIALPFGDDVERGRPMLEFVEAFKSGGSPARTLVGLGNIGYGHPEAVRIHREWMARLRDVGIDAVLLDAFEPGLRRDLPAAS
jgi:hypothetical protein